MDGRQKQEQSSELSKENRYLWTGGRERREYCSPVNIQSIKMKCVYNYCIQRCDIYVLIPSIYNQLIPIDTIIYTYIHTFIYISIVIENQYQSITT